jgi:hypothetical protein
MPAFGGFLPHDCGLGPFFDLLKSFSFTHQCFPVKLAHRLWPFAIHEIHGLGSAFGWTDNYHRRVSVGDGNPGLTYFEGG